MTLIKNENGHEHCGYCIDGWVTLKGHEMFNGVEYSRGNAPCAWCETGLRRYQHAVDPPKGGRHWMPQMDYTIDDVEIPGGDGPRFKPTPEWLEAHGVKPGMPLLKAIPDLEDDVEEKRETARIEANRLQSQKPSLSNVSSDHPGDPQVLQHAGISTDSDLPW